MRGLVGRFVLSVVLVVTVCSAAGCARSLDPRASRARTLSNRQGAMMEPQRFTLDNGLRVIIEENHAAKVVALEAWVDVGSASEPSEAAGVAHVFEHMLFKGTE